ncbi:MAG: DUF2304 domain-containing protein [Lachnospiraceae bacterium]|nr:DUF2304 domain-containing protein [Lachnospiraceae bacterium]
MSFTLRVILLIASVGSAVWILHKIRKLKVKMEDAIFWMFFAAILFIMGMFPELTYWLTGKVGMMSPANLIFLIIIALLLEKVFTLSIITSQLEEKLNILSAEIAIRDHSAERRMDRMEKDVIGQAEGKDRHLESTELEEKSEDYHGE